MTWTYSGNPAGSALDKVRFLCGDTNLDWQLLQDEEINYILAIYTDTTLAAAEACDAIAAKLSRDVDTTNLELSVRASQRAEAYVRRANELRAKVGRAATIFVGGRSPSDKDSAAEDTSRTQPAFKIGMHDYRSDDEDNE